VNDNLIAYGHLAILVSDLDRSVRWYTDAMGWVESWRQDTSGGWLGELNGLGGDGRVAMGSIASVPVELVQMVDASAVRHDRRPQQYGLFLLSARVDDYDLARKHCEELDIEIARDVEFAGGGRLLVLVDPDGQEVCLIGKAQQ
jgi:catechol 2,3-dioxygenase-like lactoylglutathione lyase family enzyme